MGVSFSPMLYKRALISPGGCAMTEQDVSFLTLTHPVKLVYKANREANVVITSKSPDQLGFTPSSAPN